MPGKISTKQREILEYIKSQILEKGFPPAVRDICEAVNLKLKITEAMENELMLEYIMKTQGYENVAVTIGTTTENVNVIVQDVDLTQDDAIKIYSTVINQLNVSPENVNIIPIS